MLDLIHEARGTLMKAHGKLGLWDREELVRAETSVNCNFLMLALNETRKAVAVSQLPRDEYEYGFNYVKPKQ